MPASDVFRRRLLRAFVALAVLGGVGAYLLVHLNTGGGPAPRCEVRGKGEGEAYELDPEQAANAATISAVASSRRLPERAVTIAIATAMQESELRNIEHGDRDSLGLFQQRPSQGWGTEEEILDPVYSTGKFYEHLAEIPGYSRLPLTEAAQRVQRSGFPQAYAKHEPAAARLAAALTGRDGGAFTCTTAKGDTRSGDPALLREALKREFGAGVLPEPDASGAGGSGEGSGGANGAGAGEVLVLPVAGDGAGGGADAAGRGWELAHWAVAQAPRLRVAQVSFAGREWRAEESSAGWREVEGANAEAGAASVRIVTEP
ncbi:heavy metal transporter [Streptomyces sp. CMB-StM0423]|uniref:heavy metal transporter n=1 Tax=Streptomyces sp. CMB-StM0423 TaxID=2059884 RepID=UPI000C713889|nr:heavy metal transporter [Streptomyces sp. CMB-StM0423]AUH40795.1 heavy metal transporter [Streptomyces sp. CMB-StM0423]